MNTDPLTTGLTNPLLLAVATGLLLLPLASFGILFFFGKEFPRAGNWLSIGSGIISLLLALFLFAQIWNQPIMHEQFTWFRLFGMGQNARLFTAGVYLDNLTVLMLVLVTFIALLVQIYSVAYLHGDPHENRYFAFLSLFTFSMLGLLLADNLLLIFVFWELVGFCSYLLIGFWFDRPAAARASTKAFIVNRVGDVGLLIGLFFLYAYFGTFDLLQLKAQFNLLAGNASLTVPASVLTLTGLALFCGCVGKSAQFPLQVWLPDAMEGPTPVSALIHAATMVAGGIYLLAKCYAFFTPDALLVMAIIGAITAFMGALAAGAQFDIKKVLAYSTVSQLGYMVMGMGVGAHDAALFHLVTHAFFKAALFLNTGIIIHAVHHALTRENSAQSALVDAQDIRNMGGLWKKLPYTFYSYLLAAAALVGVPFFSGFLSKDAILAGTWGWASFKYSASGSFWYYLVPAVGFVSVVLTAYYMVRHLIFIFLGNFRLPFGEKYLRFKENQEASYLMTWPVVLLSVLSLGIFYALNPFDATNSWVLRALALPVLNPEQVFLTEPILAGVNRVAEQNHGLHNYVAAISVLAILVGGLVAWRRFRGNLVNTAVSYELSALPPAGFSRWVYSNFYLDRVYDLVVVQPTQQIAAWMADLDQLVIDYSINGFAKVLVVFSKIVAWFDRAVVDGVVRGSAGLAGLIGQVGRLMQNGKVQTYYIFSLLGLMLLVFYILIF